MNGKMAPAADLTKRIIMAILTLSSAITILMALSARPLVATLFGYGGMSADAQQMSAQILQWMALALPALSINVFAFRVLFALHKASTVIMATLIGAALKIIIGFYGSGYLGINAISMSTISAYTISTVFVVWRINREMGGIVDYPLKMRAIKVISVFSGMALIIVVARKMTESLSIMHNDLMSLFAVISLWLMLCFAAFRTLLKVEKSDMKSLKNMP